MRITDGGWSVGSQGSWLSLWSQGSVLSIGSVGSFASIGSVGSFASLCSVGSSLSAASLLSNQSVGSVLAHAGREAALTTSATSRRPWLAPLLAAGAPGAVAVMRRLDASSG